MRPILDAKDINNNLKFAVLISLLDEDARIENNFRLTLC